MVWIAQPETNMHDRNKMPYESKGWSDDPIPDRLEPPVLHKTSMAWRLVAAACVIVACFALVTMCGGPILPP
jgi:hypothetical protein